MSEENLEIVRRAYEVMDDDVEAFLELCTDDIEFVNPADAIEPGTRSGHDGVRTWFAVLAQSFVTWRGRPVRMLEHEGVVVAETRATMVGRDSGIAVDTGFGHIWTLRDGKIQRFEWFREPEQAFRAAGLPE